MDKQIELIVWIFIIIFSLTAIITLLGITGVLKNMKAKYLNALFGALILEVVAAVVLVFQGIDFKGAANLEGILERAGVEQKFETDEQRQDYLVTQLKIKSRVSSLTSRIDSLNQLAIQNQQKLKDCEGSLGKLDKSFYTKIARLVNYQNEFGGFININWQEDQKKEAFALLHEVLGKLGYADGSSSASNDQVKKMYLRFKQKHGRDDDNRYLVLDADIAWMLTDYLDKVNATREPSPANNP